MLFGSFNLVTSDKDRHDRLKLQRTRTRPNFRYFMCANHDGHKLWNAGNNLIVPGN